MTASRPRDHLETHDVANQPPPFEDVNLFTSDVALQAAVSAAGGETHADRLSDFGARVGSAETAEWAMQANANPPQLKAFDRYGRRIDEVDFHPAYHRLMALGLDAALRRLPGAARPPATCFMPPSNF
jgi:putative acyl-CoA dehydrogenase